MVGLKERRIVGEDGESEGYTCGRRGRGVTQIRKVMGYVWVGMLQISHRQHDGQVVVVNTSTTGHKSLYSSESEATV